MHFNELFLIQLKAADDEISRLTREVETERTLQQQITAKLERSTDLSDQLEKGLREVREELRVQFGENSEDCDENGHSKTGHLSKQFIAELQCPSLDKLLAAMDARGLADDFECAKYLKSRVDYLEVRVPIHVFGMLHSCKYNPVFILTVFF